MPISPTSSLRTSYVPIIVAGGIRGVYDATQTYETLMRKLPDRYAEARRHYAVLNSEGTQFETPRP